MSLIFVLLIYIGSLWAAAESPQKIIARRQLQSWPANFTLENSQYEEEKDVVAEVEANFYGAVREYDLYEEGKELLARAKHSLFRACNLFTVEAADETFLGLIEEFPDHFNLYDQEHTLIATSQTNYWETQILLLDNEGEVIGSLSRPLLRAHDGWSLSLKHPSDWSLNKVLWLLLPAIHTDKPYWQTFTIFHSQNPKPSQ